MAPGGCPARAWPLASGLALWGLCPAEDLLEPGGHVFRGDWQLAGATGLFFDLCALHERVVPGQPLAEIRNTTGEVLERLTAPHAGQVIAIRHKAYIRQGDWGILVASDA